MAYNPADVPAPPDRWITPMQWLLEAGRSFIYISQGKLAKGHDIAIKRSDMPERSSQRKEGIQALHPRSRRQAIDFPIYLQLSKVFYSRDCMPNGGRLHGPASLASRMLREHHWTTNCF